MKPNTFSLGLFALLTSFALSPTTRAVLPAPTPDGAYPGWNTAEGSGALFNVTSGTFNTAVGGHALYEDATGSSNTAVGAFSLAANSFASQNVAIGQGALRNNTGGDANTAIGFQALVNNARGPLNTATGAFALYSNTLGGENTANGVGALQHNRTGSDNAATGNEALQNNWNGDFNTANGAFALRANTGGGNNTAIGEAALLNNTTGSHNTGLGGGAGTGITTASNVICIGANVAGDDVSNSTWLGNIYGITTQSGTTAPVVVSDTGQLGTVASSERFKKDIATLETASEAILSLRPVTFHYKTDSKRIPQFGLIAEEVAKVNPALVVPDKEGKPYSVRYDAVNAMLLNEFLKERSKVEKLEATITKQHTDFEAALADLKGQIQKVSAQLQLNRTAPQTVLNNQ